VSDQRVTDANTLRFVAQHIGDDTVADELRNIANRIDGARSEEAKLIARAEEFMRAHVEMILSLGRMPNADEILVVATWLAGRQR
jgi:hypothetical protein